MSADARRTLSDVAVLYELSLALGTSLDLDQTCGRFLRPLMARKRLDLAQVWLREDVRPAIASPSGSGADYLLAFASPRAHAAARRVSSASPLAARVRRGESFCAAPGELELAPMLGAALARGAAEVGGALAVFPLGELGFALLHSSDEAAFAQARALRQLESIMQKFSVALAGCIAHENAIREIEERKKAERANAAAQAQLHQSQKLEAVGRLAGGIAHDFNNLLTGILGCAELLSREEMPESRRALVDIIVSAAQSATGVTRELLTFSRAAPIEGRDVPVLGWVDQVVALLERMMPPRIHVRVEHGLAPAACVAGDPSRLQSALLNLAINARDAIDAVGTIRFVTDSIEHEGRSYARVRVIDTGRGMSAETVDRIFEPFFSTKEAGRGTGLGLPAAHGTFASHGGKLLVESQLGHGTCFTVLLPLVAGVAAADDSAVLAPAGQGCVLVVDRDEIAREALVRMCRHFGYEALSGTSAEFVRSAFAERGAGVRAVLVDARLPHSTAADALREVRDAAPGVPLVVLSGFMDHDLASRVEGVAIAELVQKPVALDRLGEILASVIG